MVLSKEYMEMKGIKSKQTLYNLQQKGKIKLIKKDNKNYVISLEDSNDIDLFNEEYEITKTPDEIMIFHKEKKFNKDDLDYILNEFEGHWKEQYSWFLQFKIFVRS